MFPINCIYVFPMIPSIKSDYLTTEHNRLLLIMVTQYAFHEVRTKFLNTI
jgi:hypothetical protein